MIDRFLADRGSDWRRLEALLARAAGRPDRLSAAEIEQLGRLYRRATSDLAVARRDFPTDGAARYLEQLIGRAHLVVYQRQPGDWTRLPRFLAVGFPRAFRAAWGYTALALALFGLAFAAAFLATWLDPTSGRVILASRPFVESVEAGQSWLDVDDPARPLLASLVTVNNVQVTFLAFAGGLLFGLGSAYVLLLNGAMIGATAALAGSYGLGGTLGDFVLAHGGVELTVVFVAGGAGLRIGHAMLDPGLRPRRVALAAAARQGVRLLVGCVPLLAIAGLLEGFVSPSGLPTAVKAAVGGGATLLLFAYLLLAGRRS